MTKRLVALVNAEIIALETRKLDGGSTNWDEKERLAHSWRLEVAQIKANPAALAGVTDDRKADLKEASKELEASLARHARSLSAMKEVTEGLVRTIASEIAAVRAAPAGYGRGGSVLQQPSRAASGLAVDAKA
jgi:hypothetical protein